MTRKQIGAILGVVVFAVAAPLLTLALLHALDGKAQAAPPPNFTKVSMPDFGQHSANWCWVASAADSFWWFAHNTTGQDNLLGGPTHPWEAIDTISQIPPGEPGYDACWYDANDTAQGAAGPVGYRQLLSKIAATTFKDANQDGIKQPAENNYCYSDGVEKWDYLIGLRDYVNTNGYHLEVHDIIDPAKCGVGTGMLPVRPQPWPRLMNQRDPCGKPGVPGVPGVDQVKRPPTLADYQTELSAGQDVLLWMEGTSPEETAHVVTGVGYTPGTVTIANPWTHSTCGDHDDCWPLKALPDGQMPDHNNDPDHDVGPYDLCTVVNPGPNPKFQIQCGLTTWTVYDMIFVSKVEPDKRVDHMSVDYLGNDYDPQTEPFDILKSTNKAISIHSFDVNPIAYTVDSDITFLADIPQYCEGRWLAQQGDTLHDYELYNPSDPLDQIHGTAHGGVKVPADPTKDEEPYLAAESAIHFQLAEPSKATSDLWRNFELHCYKDGDFTFTFYNKIEPKEPWVDPNLENNWARLDVMVHSVPNADVDIVLWVAPSPINAPIEQWLPEPFLVDEIKHNNGPQDTISWASWRVDPADLYPNTPVEARWVGEVEQGDTCWYRGAQVDCTEWWAIDELQFYLYLPVSSDVPVERWLNLACWEPGGPYFVTLINEEWPTFDPESGLAMEDPDPTNNIRTFDIEVYCVNGYADKMVEAITLDKGNLYPSAGDPLPEPLNVIGGQTNRISVTSKDVITGEPSAAPWDAYASFLANIPKGCEGVWVYDQANGDDLLTKNGWVDIEYPLKQLEGEVATAGVKIPGDGDPYTVESDLHFYLSDYYGEYPEGYEGVYPPRFLLRFFDLRCPTAGQYTFSFYNKIEPIGAVDPDLDNNWLKRDLVVNVAPAWDRDLDCHWNDFGGVDKETLHGSNPDDANSTPEVCDGIDNDGNDGIDEGWMALGNPQIRDCDDPELNTDDDQWNNQQDTDDDNDGCSDAEEAYMASDPLDACADDSNDQSWCLDMNNDRVIRMDDVLYYAGKLKARLNEPLYVCRLDFNMDQVLRMDDVLKYAGQLKQTCTP